MKRRTKVQRNIDSNARSAASKNNTANNTVVLRVNEAQLNN